MPSERSMTITVHESQKTPTTVKDTIKAKKKKDKKAVPEKTNLNRFINSIFGSKPKKRSAETKKESEQDTQQIDEELKVKKRKKKFKNNNNITTLPTKKQQIKQTVPPMMQRVPSMPVAATQLANVLSGLHHTFVVADNTLPDCPLVYASEG